MNIISYITNLKTIYIILVVSFLSCTSTTNTPPPTEREILGTDIEVNKSTGKTTIVTRYSDSTITVVNLNAAGELMDSTTHFYTPSK